MTGTSLKWGESRRYKDLSHLLVEGLSESIYTFGWLGLGVGIMGETPESMTPVTGGRD